MPMPPVLETTRLRLDGFVEEDVPALAAILAEPDVTKTITANASTPERCRASAVNRIRWHGESWDRSGYGVWAVRSRDGALMGWCGFAEPDIGTDPEILYGLAPAHWGQGAAQEAIRASLDWLFAETEEAGVSAVIFGRLNPVSVTIAEKFGWTWRGTMAMRDFLSSHDLARDVIAYDIWRLANGSSHAPEALLFEAPYRGGQVASLGIDPADEIEAAFVDAAAGRADLAGLDPEDRAGQVRSAFAEGMNASWLDWYHMTRAVWLRTREGA